MNKLYFSASYLTNAPTIAHAPDDVGGEVAFAGRSNAGKSSAINALTNNKSLARTSKTPGRTQHLVFFQITELTRFVDMPGYGYAKVPDKVKRQWHAAMEQYLSHRRSLQGLILVMDCRHPLREFDRQMLEWCQQSGLPAHVLLSKADKLKPNAARAGLDAVRQEIDLHFPNTSIQNFSASKKHGIDEAHTVLDEWLNPQ